MKEFGIVTKLNNSNATVKVDKKDECSKCGMCLFPANARSIEFQAKNDVGASQGDTVLIQVKDQGKLTALILVFLVPLLLILLSSLIAQFVIGQELWMLWLSLMSVTAWFLVLPLIDKRLKKTKQFSTEIISLIKSNEKENENE